MTAERAPTKWLGRSARAHRPRRWSQAMGAGHGLLLAAPLLVLTALMLVLPLWYLASTTFEGGVGQAFQAFVDNEGKVRSLWVTIRDSLLVTALSLLFGSAVAWILARQPTRLVALTLVAALFLPAAMGTVPKLYAWGLVLAPNGVLDGAFGLAGIGENSPDLLFTEGAVIVGMVYQMMIYAVLPMRTAFRSIDEDLLRASSSLGASGRSTIRTIVLPLVTPTLLATGSMIFVICLGFYMTPVLLGGASTNFIAGLISQDVFLFANLQGAAISGFVLLSCGAAVIAAAWLAVGGERLRRTLG
jgi:ABC-type spermidine/putrescine transport system permease subunit I